VKLWPILLLLFVAYGCIATPRFEHVLDVQNNTAASFYLRTYDPDNSGPYISAILPLEHHLANPWSGGQPRGIQLIDGDCVVVAQGSIDGDRVTFAPVDGTFDAGDVEASVRPWHPGPNTDYFDSVSRCGGLLRG
jgi:hypothetical protein